MRRYFFRVAHERGQLLLISCSRVLATITDELHMSMCSYY